MRLEHIQIEGFRGFSEATSFDLDADVILLQGANGTGKTSLLDAILWTLTGAVNRPGWQPTPASVLSLYSREGVARVELTLKQGAERLTIIRTSSGAEQTNLMLRAGELELTGNQAEAELLERIAPQCSREGDSHAAVCTMFARGVYLQQDIIRQFIETDTDEERFSFLAQVIGAGAVQELQSYVERSRAQWSKSTNALKTDTLHKLERQLKDVEDQLQRLSLPEVHNDEGRGEISLDLLFSEAAKVVSAELLPAPDTIRTTGGLDRFLRQLVNLRTQVERDISFLKTLIQEADQFREIDLAAGADVKPFQEKERELTEEVELIDAQMKQELSNASEAQARLLEAYNKLERQAALARLALEQLSDRCPVCDQLHDLAATRTRLQSIVTQSTAPPSDTFAQPREITELNRRRSSLLSELEQVRVNMRQLVARDQDRRASFDTFRARLDYFDLTPDDLKSDALEKLLGIREAMFSELSRIYAMGEQLSLAVVEAREARRRVELTTAREKIQENIQAIEKQFAEQQTTYDLATEVIDALREASLRVTERQAQRILPLFQRIYGRIDPHPTFRAAQFMTKLWKGKGRLRTGVIDYKLGETAHDVMPLLSSSQLNAYAVSLFLAFNLSLPDLRLHLTMLDDPLQSLDPINLLGMVDVLRRFREHRQLIISTHESRLVSLLQRKLRPVRSGERMVIINFSSWDRSGPSVAVSVVHPENESLRVLAA